MRFIPNAIILLRNTFFRKSLNDGHLIAAKKEVHRKDGSSFYQTKYIRPEQAESHVKKGRVWQIHDKPGIRKIHANRHFKILGKHAEKQDHYHVEYDHGGKGVVKKQNILKHSHPVMGKTDLSAEGAAPIQIKDGKIDVALPKGHKAAEQKKEAPRQAPEDRPDRDWVEKLDHLPDDTQKKYKINGEYTPERKALHEKIISSFFDHIQTPPAGHRKVAVLMAGGTASGKSTILKKIMSAEAQKHFVMVDPDGIKEMLPEFQEGLKGNAMNSAFMTHEESSDIADELRARALKAGKQVILDGTMKNTEKYEALIKQIKKDGYITHGVMVDTDIDTAKASSDARANRTGRYVPHSVIENIYPAVRKSFPKLKHLFHDFSIWDRRGAEPQKVMDKKNGILNKMAVQTIFGGLI